MKKPSLSKKNILIIVLLVGVPLLWLSSRVWLPWIYNLVPVLNENKSTIQVVRDILTIFSLLIGFATLLFHKPAVEETVVTALENISVDSIVPGKGGEVPWVARGGIDQINLDANRMLLITGSNKTGKSRAAAELIRRAIREEKVPANRIFAPWRKFGNTDPGTVYNAIIKQVDPKKPALLYIEDLPLHFPAVQRSLLQYAIYALKNCASLYVIADAEADQMDLHYTQWLRGQGFGILTLQKLNQDQTNALAEAASKTYGVTLDPGAQQILLERSEGNPERVINPLRRLANMGKLEVNGDEMTSLVQFSLQQEWQASRTEIKQKNPLAANILESLSIFVAAGSVPRTDLVCRYAMAKTDGGKPDGEACKAALQVLRNYDILDDGERLHFSEMALDLSGIDAKEAAADLSAFADHYAGKVKKLTMDETRLALADMMFEVGLKAHLRNDLATAVGYYDKSMTFDTNSPVEYNRGVALYQMGEYQRAIEDFNKVVESPVFGAKAYNNRGASQLELGHLPQAYADFTKALEQQPDFVLAYQNRADAAIRMNALEEAQQDIEKAHAISPNQFINHVLQGQLNYAGSDFPAALSAFRRAAALADNPKDFHLDQALALLAMNDGEHALALVRERLYGQPSPQSVRIILPAYETLKLKKPNTPAVAEAVGMLRRYLGLEEE